MIMTTTGKIATGFVLGSMLGVTLGILFAPAKGSKTRARLGDKATRIGESVNENYQKVKNMVSKGKKEVELINTQA